MVTERFKLTEVETDPADHGFGSQFIGGIHGVALGLPHLAWASEAGSKHGTISEYA